MTTENTTIDDPSDYYITERFLLNSECQRAYGSSDIHEVNRKLETDAPNTRAYLPACSGGLILRTIHRESESA